MLDQPVDHRRVGVFAEAGPHQGGRRAAAEGPQRHRGERAGRPQLGETFGGLRPAGGQHPEGLAAELGERGVDGGDARQVAPVEVLEHQEEGLGARLGGEEVEPGAAQLVAHQLGIAAGGAQGRIVVVFGAGADQLAEEEGHPFGGGVVQVAAQPGPQLAAFQGRRLVVADRRGVAQGRAEQAEGRGGGQRVGAAQPDLGVPLVRLDEARPARRGGATCRRRAAR